MGRGGRASDRIRRFADRQRIFPINRFGKRIDHTPQPVFRRVQYGFRIQYFRPCAQRNRFHSPIGHGQGAMVPEPDYFTDDLLVPSCGQDTSIPD